MFEFEDDGGILPVHEVGISAGGAVPGTGGALQYVAEIGNGRSWVPSAEINDSPDTNDAKSSNVALAFRPGRWRGLELGTSFYRDQIPVDPGPLDHRVLTAYGVYKTPSFEFMAEWLRLEHVTPDGTTFVNHAGYVQVSKAWGRLVSLRPPGDQSRYTVSVQGSTTRTRRVAVDAGQWVGFGSAERTTSRTSIDTCGRAVFVF